MEIKANSLNVIQFSCPSCANAIKVPAKYGGRTAKCKTCGHQLRIPSQNPAAILGADTATGSSRTKKCPACAETILAEARKCRFCGEILDIEALEDGLLSNVDNRVPPITGDLPHVCSMCGTVMPKSIKRCPNCGHVMGHSRNSRAVRRSDSNDRPALSSVLFQLVLTVLTVPTAGIGAYCLDLSGFTANMKIANLVSLLFVGVALLAVVLSLIVAQRVYRYSLLTVLHKLWLLYSPFAVVVLLIAVSLISRY